MVLVNVDAPRKQGMFSKMPGIDFRHFLCFPHPLPQLLNFLHSIAVYFPLQAFLEVPATQARFYDLLVSLRKDWKIWVCAVVFKERIVVNHFVNTIRLMQRSKIYGVHFKMS